MAGLIPHLASMIILIITCLAISKVMRKVGNVNWSDFSVNERYFIPAWDICYATLSATALHFINHKRPPTREAFYLSEIRGYHTWIKAVSKGGKFMEWSASSFQFPAYQYHRKHTRNLHYVSAYISIKKILDIQIRFIFVAQFFGIHSIWSSENFPLWIYEKIIEKSHFSQNRLTSHHALCNGGGVDQILRYHPPFWEYFFSYRRRW